MKILFIDPPGYQRQGFNLGLAMLCSALARDGYNPAIFDRNEGGDLNLVLTVMRPGVVGISIKSATFSAAKKMAKEVRACLPGTVIIGGGPHPTIEPGDMLSLSEDFDLVLVGEGEQSVVELCRRLRDTGLDPDDKPNNDNGLARRAILAQAAAGIPGVGYRDADGEVVTGPPVIIQDLDQLAYPRLESFINLDAAARPYHLMTSRGCPFRCAYCSVRSISGRKLRTRSVESVVEELLFARSTYGIDGFEVDDDNFTLQIDRAKMICEAMVQRRVEIPWYLPNGIRAEMLDRELAHLLKLANCHTVALGIESSDPEVLHTIHKGMKPTQVQRAIKLLQAEGIRVMGFFIIGLPGSSLESDLSTIEFERNLTLDDRIYNAFVPYPCTEGYEWAKEHGNFLADYRDALHFSDRDITTFETDEYPEPQRKAAMALARMGTKALARDDFQLMRELVLRGMDPDTLVVEVESYLPDISEVLEHFTPLTRIQVKDRTTQEIVCTEPDGHVSHRSPLKRGFGWQNDISLALGLGRALAGRRFQLAIVPQIHSYLVLSMLTRSKHRFQYDFQRHLSSISPREILVESPTSFLRSRVRSTLRQAVPDPVRGAEVGFRLNERLGGARVQLSETLDRLGSLPRWLGEFPLTAGIAATSQLGIAAIRLRRKLGGGR